MDTAAEREFREYVATRQGALYRIALLLTGHREDAEDLLQIALTKLALHWTSLARSGSADAYVRKILYHQQVSRWRSRGRRREHVTADPPDAGTVTDPAAASTMKITLERVLRQLTRRQRAVVVLRYYEDLPEAEVAKILGCSVGTVGSQNHRGLARLRVLCPEFTSIKETACRRDLSPS
jgi:RNA polymerase sigma-70 factor (sigma-E family)